MAMHPHAHFFTCQTAQSSNQSDERSRSRGAISRPSFDRRAHPEGWMERRQAPGCDRAPAGVHLTRHAGGGLTYRPIAPMTLGRCAQRRSIVAILGKVSALSAPRQVGRGGSAISSLPCLVRPGRRSLPPGRRLRAALTGTPLHRSALRTPPEDAPCEPRMPVYVGDSLVLVK